MSNIIYRKPGLIIGLNEFGGRTSHDDPLKVFLYRLEVDGFVRAGASEITGFGEVEHEVTEYREGGDNATVRKSPGLGSFAPLVVKRGLMIGSTRGGDNDYADWAAEIHRVNSGGAPSDFRRTLDIALRDREGREKMRLRYFECWPSKFKAGADLDGKSSDDHIEELTIEHEGFARIVS